MQARILMLALFFGAICIGGMVWALDAASGFASGFKSFAANVAEVLKELE